MVLQETSAYCEYCRRPVLGRRDGPNHLVHALVSLFLCGLWIPVWILTSMSVGEYACPNCGGRVGAGPGAFPQNQVPVRQLAPEEEADAAASRARTNKMVAVGFGLLLVVFGALGIAAYVTWK